MTWASKRQLFYSAIVTLFLLGFGYLIISPYFNKPPTCNDGKQNGDETGIDCGGTCALACRNQVDQVSILWARAFEVIPGRYNALAYLENQNKNTAIMKIKYRFRFADENNIYIGKRDGETYIPPTGKFAIFEPGIGLGNSVPVYTSFEFTEVPTWIVVSQTKIDQLNILVSDIKLTDETTSPRLSATVLNDSFYKIPEVNFITILYNEAGNAIAASRTYLDVLDGKQSSEINFTWPEAFSEKVVAKEIIPIFNIFNVSLR